MSSIWLFQKFLLISCPKESYPKNKTDWQLDPSRAVLLIHDMQRYFLNFYDAESELIKTVVNHLVQLRTWAHQNNVPVVYTAQPYEQPAADRALLNAMWDRVCQPQQSISKNY